MEHSCLMVSINAGPSHQHAPFIDDDGSISGKVIMKVDGQHVVRVSTALLYTLPTTDMDQYTRSFWCFSASLILAKYPVIAAFYNPEATQFDGCRIDCGHRVEAITALFALKPTLPFQAIARPLCVTSHSHISLASI